MTYLNYVIFENRKGSDEFRAGTSEWALALQMFFFNIFTPHPIP
jgi:hypothetical protein